MKRFIKIIKASWFMDESNFKWLFLLFVIFTGLISINTCFDLEVNFMKYFLQL
ncbi:hypothetical protein [Clostridium sp.]|uniref:hypothetical protein n=1 Tax=Clostridium sp. TaxID=1506 RepID=UPI003F4B6DAB